MQNIVLQNFVNTKVNKVADIFINNISVVKYLSQLSVPLKMGTMDLFLFITFGCEQFFIRFFSKNGINI